MAFRAIRYTNEHEIYLRITTNLPSLNNLSNLRKPRKHKDLRRFFYLQVRFKYKSQNKEGCNFAGFSGSIVQFHVEIIFR